jgi:hypothetical protein
MKKVLEYLKAYHKDLEYQFEHMGEGAYSVNHCTSGTDFFDNDAEAKTYIDNLAQKIKLMERAV